KIVFVLEAPLKQHELYLPILQNLCDLGYRFAVNYPYNFDQHDPVMDLCSYIFLSQRPERKDETERIFRDIKVKYPKLEPIATHIYTEEVLKSLYEKGYAMYESRFYRVPASKTHGTISPLKINAVRLINTVQDENFDFDNVSSVVQRDPALTISLLKIVNAHHMRSSNKIKTIPQAVAMMGQQEVRKWVTTAVSQSLGDDRPNEVTRMSLIRAKFAENLSPLFEMAHMSGELFLMGLFSVIDVILEVPMEEALNMVLVSDTIRNALLKGEGIFANVLKMVTDYENANWSAVSRHMIVHDIAEEALSKSYIDALVWYRNLIMQDEEELIAEVNSAEATAE
ncbi:MAG: HDOD domain-containing protein, partial [Oscillospiraceae bacterium]|nr:HDOD domain-containing protein [Oscillospiraceae bacterium]